MKWDDDDWFFALMVFLACFFTILISAYFSLE